MKQIRITNSTGTEAMAQIDALEDLSVKNKGCLRLLTEEMYSMIYELLQTDSLDFEISIDERKYTLCASARARVSEEARKEFLSMSSDGKNAANKGIKGMLGAIMESLLYGDESAETAAPWRYGMMTPMGGEYAQTWVLSQYIDYAPPENVKKDWDGMEKSIIANFADDIEIGVRSGRLEMTVTKEFA